MPNQLRWQFDPRGYTWLVLLSFVSLQGWLLWMAAERLSPTPDELPHLTAGLEVILASNFDAYDVNPPLLKTLTAIGPFDYGSRPPSLSFDSTGSRRLEFLVGAAFRSRDPWAAWQSLIAARRSLIPLHLLGTVALFLLVAEMSGRLEGLLAAFLWSFSPMMLGLGPILSFDVPAASITAILALQVWLCSTRPSKIAFISLGLWIGIGCLVKFSLIPISALMLAWLGFIRLHDKSLSSSTVFRRTVRAASPIMFSIFFAWFILIAGYHFDLLFKSVDQFEFRSRLFSSCAELLRWASIEDSMLVPLPQAMLNGLDRQFTDLDTQASTLLFGEWYQGGDSLTYLVGLSMKMPLELIALLTLGLLRIM